MKGHEKCLTRNLVQCSNGPVNHSSLNGSLCSGLTVNGATATGCRRLTRPTEDGGEAGEPCAAGGGEGGAAGECGWAALCAGYGRVRLRSEEHTSELQSLRHLVCRLLLEKTHN